MSRQKHRGSEEKGKPASPQALQTSIGLADWLTGWRAALILYAAGAIAYANALPGILFWDNQVLITDNVFLRDWRYLNEIWTTSLFEGGGVHSNYYRPLPVTILLVCYQLWGAAPLGYHALVIALHLVAGVLLWLYLRNVLRDPRASFAAGLLFLLHPIQNETVNYVDHFEAILAFIFGLLALRAQLSGRSFLSAAAWALGLISKEEAVVFAPILALQAILRPEAGEPLARDRWLKSLLALWPHVLVAAAYLVLRLTVLNFLGTSALEYGAQVAYAPLPIRLLTFAKALLVYFRLFVWPTGLHFDRDMLPASGLSDPYAWGAVVLDAAIVAGLWRAGRGSWSARFGLLWFAAALFPYSGILAFNNILAEHFLYIPSAGLFACLGVLAVRALQGRKEIAYALVAILGVFYLGQNWARNKDWQDPKRLYETTLAGNPRSHRAANNLGSIYRDLGKPDEARRLYELAIRHGPTFTQVRALNNLGTLEMDDKKYEASVPFFLKALEGDPAYAMGHKNSAAALYRLGRFDEAAKHARLAVELDERFADAWEVQARVLYAQGKLKLAADSLRRAAVLAPSAERARSTAVVLTRLGGEHFQAGRLEEAKAAFAEAAGLDPGYAPALNNLGAVTEQMGAPEEALAHYERAVAADDSYAPARDNLERLRSERSR